MALVNRAQLVTSQTWDDNGEIAKNKRHAAGTSVCHHRRAIAGKAEKYAVGFSLWVGVTIRTMFAMFGDEFETMSKIKPLVVFDELGWSSPR